MSNRPPPKVIVTAWVRHLIDGWRNERPQPPYRTIGARIGCSKPNASNIHKGNVGVGPDIEARIAAKLFNGSTDKLRAEAVRWWDAEGAAKSASNLRPVAMEDGDGSEFGMAAAALRALYGGEDAESAIRIALEGARRPGADRFEIFMTLVQQRSQIVTARAMAPPVATVVPANGKSLHTSHHG